MKEELFHTCYLNQSYAMLSVAQVPKSHLWLVKFSNGAFAELIVQDAWITHGGTEVECHVSLGEETRMIFTPQRFVTPIPKEVNVS